jgi:hypothetical protein
LSKIVPAVTLVRLTDPHPYKALLTPQMKLL